MKKKQNPGKCGDCPYYAKVDGLPYFCSFKLKNSCTTEDHRCDEEDRLGHIIHEQP